MAAPTFTLPGEGTYGLDEQMREDARKQSRAKTARSYARAAELGQRMVSRAEALGWPWHSLTLASMHLEVAQMWANKRNEPPVELTPTAAEVDATEAGLRIIFARLKAGTLLRAPTACDRAAYDALVAVEDGVCCSGKLSDSSDTESDTEEDEPPYMPGYFVTLMATRLLLRQAISAWQVGAIYTDDDVLVQVPQVRLRPELKRLLDVVLYVRRATSWRYGHAEAGEWHVEAGVQWPPRPSYYTPEAYLLKFLEIVVGYLKTHPVISRAGLPEDVTMLQGTLLEFTELMNECSDNGTDMCARARQVVARVQQHTEAQQTRVRGRWVPRACEHCGAREDEPKQYKVCARCGAVAYCCKEHQAAHWKAVHKRDCKSVAASGGMLQPSAGVA